MSLYLCVFTRVFTCSTDDPEMPEIVPDLLDRVDRALELVSKFKELDAPPPKLSNTKPTPNQAVSTSRRTNTVISKVSKVPPTVSKAPKLPALPVRPQSGRGTCVKPAHMTAPFKTNPNIPASNYRRKRTPVSGMQTKRSASTSAASASSAASGASFSSSTRRPAPATSRQWLSSSNAESDTECMLASKFSTTGAGRSAKFAPPATPEALEVSASQKETTAAGASGEWQARVREPRAAGDELRRSFSVESLNSPRIEVSGTKTDKRCDIKAKL